MKRNSLVVISGLILLLLTANSLHACVGRLLIVAVGDSMDQVIMGQMLSILINERTGTTVNTVQPGDLKRCHEAVLNGKADIYINYIGMGLAGKGRPNKVEDPQKVYTLVSQSYMEKFGMVWLKPFGFRGPLTSNHVKDSTTLAAPVTTKEVLKKFPILDRLINKLGGRIDNKTIDELRGKTKNQDINDVVREFLKNQRLI